MIRIDMQLPENCLDCPFRDEVSSSCLASGDPGFCVFVGLQKEELIEWEDWKQKASSGRDPRCPLKAEHDLPCCNCPLQPVRPTYRDNKGYCGQCGKRIPLKINADFCHKCGREINWLP